MILRGLAAEGGTVSVAAFWAGAAGRVESVAAFGRGLRTLGGKNIGKCRLRAHQHPLLPPLPNRHKPIPM